MAQMSHMDQIPHRYRGNMGGRTVTKVRRCLHLGLRIQILVVALLVSAASAQSPKQLWVLREPDDIVAYDAASFVAQRTLKVPRRVLEHPEYLSVNQHGQMLFLPPEGVQWGSELVGPIADRTWYWDGRRVPKLKFEATKTRGLSAGKPTVTETVPQCLLSSVGDSLLWFENRFEKVLGESDIERSVRSAWRAWRTDLAGGRPETVVRLSSPETCQCDTGVCSETCPEWSFWAPDGVVGDFFLATRFTPGQIGTTYHESFIYERSGRMWQAKKLPQPIEQPLTASEKGEVLVAAVLDGGCCGWENAGSDQMMLVRNGKVSVLYDEFGRYDNLNYDVSFYVADARLAVGNAMLAYTIVSTARIGDEIRLSSDGKENSEELARVRKTIAELPAVEVMQLGTQPRPTAVIRHAALVGWMSDHEILVAQDGRLVVYDIRGRKQREITIRVRSAADAFLR